MPECAYVCVELLKVRRTFQLGLSLPAPGERPMTKRVQRVKKSASVCASLQMLFFGRGYKITEGRTKASRGPLSNNRLESSMGSRR